MENIVNAFNDISDNELSQINDPFQIIYEQFEIKKVLKYFQQIKLIKKSIQCQMIRQE